MGIAHYMSYGEQLGMIEGRGAGLAIAGPGALADRFGRVPIGQPQLGAEVLAGFLIASGQPHAPAVLIKSLFLGAAGRWHALAWCAGVGISGTYPCHRRIRPSKPSSSCRHCRLPGK
jgi:hypothetical protein